MLYSAQIKAAMSERHRLYSVLVADPSIATARYRSNKPPRNELGLGAHRWETLCVELTAHDRHSENFSNANAFNDWSVIASVVLSVSAHVVLVAHMTHEEAVP